MALSKLKGARFLLEGLGVHCGAIGYFNGLHSPHKGSFKLSDCRSQAPGSDRIGAGLDQTSTFRHYRY